MNSPEHQRTLEQTKSHLQDLFLHDVAVKQEIGRVAVAQGYGLNPEQFRRPFPGSTQNITIMQNQPQTAAEPTASQAEPAAAPASVGFLQSPAGKLLGKAVGATLLGGPVGAGLVYLGTLLGQGGQPAAPPKPVEFELQWKVVDGKFEQKIVPVEPGK